MQHIHQHIHLFKEVTVNATHTFRLFKAETYIVCVCVCVSYTHTFRLFKEEEETYSLIEALQFSSVTVMS